MKIHTSKFNNFWNLNFIYNNYLTEAYKKYKEIDANFVLKFK